MTRSKSTAGGRLLESSLASASSLMALQLLSRLFTFGLNQALFRLATPSAFGAAAIQFELILSTILFLSREGIRNSLLRVPSRSSNEARSGRRTQSRLSSFPIFAGIPLAMGTAFLYMQYAGQEIKQQPYFKSTIALYALAAVIELFSEPFYNLAMAELQTGVRVRAEGLGIVAKCVTTFLVLLYDSKSGNGHLSLLAFAFGQLLYGVVMFAIYVAYFGIGDLQFTSPSKLEAADRQALHLSYTMTVQSLVKHFLTEGDKMLLSYFSPLQDQGGYAIAVNYGSLVARIIFQPIEESLRVYFSKTLGSAVGKGDSSGKEAPFTHSIKTLRSLLSIQISLSVILVTFGSGYISLLLPILLPSQYLSTSAPEVLAAWVWYIPVLAVNGGLEAFLASVATSKDLNAQSRWMVGFSVIYIFAAIFLYHFGFGDASLVYANIFNLAVRIIYSFSFTTDFFITFHRSSTLRWRDILPPRTLCVACGVSALVIQASARHFHVDATLKKLGKASLLNRDVLCHLGVGTSLGMLCVLTWWMSSGRCLIIDYSRRKSE
ncbi:Rft-1-domain-containing protein [Agrocybe pediades]|nr:Rft-1-domain-containing protein [Agrocybe pediades]